MMFLALMRKESSLSVKMTEVRIVADTYAWIEGPSEIEAEIFIFNSFIV